MKTKSEKHFNMTVDSLNAAIDTARKEERERVFDFVQGYYSAVLATILHDKWDFDEKDLRKVLVEIADLYDSLMKGYVDVKDLRKTLLEETNIDLTKRILIER